MAKTGKIQKQFADKTAKKQQNSTCKFRVFGVYKKTFELLKKWYAING